MEHTEERIVSTPGLPAAIAYGDLVLLWFDNEVTYLIEVAPGKKVNIHCGKPLAVDEWIGRKFGERINCEHGYVYLLRPSLFDLMMKASRESGIIYPKDAAYLIMKAGIVSGAKVLEIGTGSGSLTMALASTVRPAGSVWSYDRRTDLPKNAHKNVTRSGLAPYVVFGQRQQGEPFTETGFDAVILDIPTPWEEIHTVTAALKSGGRLVSLNPTFNQIERMAEAMRSAGFILVESVELLEREILARGGKTRPVQRMVSHTEFMLFGLWPGGAPAAAPAPVSEPGDAARA